MEPWMLSDLVLYFLVGVTLALALRSLDKPRDRMGPFAQNDLEHRLSILEDRVDDQEPLL